VTNTGSIPEDIYVCNCWREMQRAGAFILPQDYLPFKGFIDIRSDKENITVITLMLPVYTPPA
jgi:hypothetical protein